MASGDSAENVRQRRTTLLAASVHRICDLDDEAHAPRIAVQPGIQQPDHGGELSHRPPREPRSVRNPERNGKTRSRMTGLGMMEYTRGAGLAGFGRINPAPKYSWAISRSSR